jgi:hypothetical protein
LRDIEPGPLFPTETLDDLDWLRATLVDCEIQPDAETVWVDVDLPEIGDLPQSEVRMAKRRRRLLKREGFRAIEPFAMVGALG